MSKNKFLKYSLQKLLNVKDEDGNKIDKTLAQAKVVQSLKADKKNENVEKNSRSQKQDKIKQKPTESHKNLDNDQKLLNNFKIINDHNEKIAPSQEEIQDSARQALLEQSEKTLLYSYILRETDLESLEKLINGLPQSIRDKLNELENEEYEKREVAESVNEAIEHAQHKDHSIHLESNNALSLELLSADKGIQLFENILQGQKETLNDDLLKYAEDNNMHKECAQTIKSCLNHLEVSEKSIGKYHPELEHKIKSVSNGLNYDSKLEPIVKLLTMKIQSMEPEEREKCCKNLLTTQQELEKKSLEKANNVRTQNKNQTRSVGF